MKKLILLYVVLTSFSALADKQESNFYQVFRTDNEHCFAVDAKNTVYRIDDVNFKCSESSQPNPDKLVAIEKHKYLGDVVPADNAKVLKEMVMGNIVDLSGVKNNMYLYRTAKGTLNGEPVFENYFVNIESTANNSTRIGVSVLRFEYDKETGARTNRLGTNYQNFTFPKLANVPNKAQEVLVQTQQPIAGNEEQGSKVEVYPYISEGKIEAREIPILDDKGKKVSTVVTADPVSTAPILTEVEKPNKSDEVRPVAKQVDSKPAESQIKYIYEKEYCSDIFKRYGRRLADQDCSQVKNEKFSQRCLLDKHCNFENSCNSEQCVQQYQELGRLEDIQKLMNEFNKSRSRLYAANSAFKAAEKSLIDCDSLDKDAEQRVQKAKNVESARVKKNNAQKNYNLLREKLDQLVQSKIESSQERYSCIKYAPATFRYFYDSWLYILDYHARYWTCFMGPRDQTTSQTQNSGSADRGPNATKKKSTKKKN